MAIFAVGGYYLRSRQSGTNTPPLQEGQTGSLPPGQAADGQNSSQQDANGSGLTIASQSRALDYFVDASKNVFVIQPDGQVIKSSDGRDEKISEGPIAGITGASFSFDGKKIMATIGGGSQVKIEIFDVEQKIWRLLPNIAQSPVWSPYNHQLAFLSKVGDSTALYTLNADDPKAKPVEATRIRQQDMVLDWVSRSKILLGDAPNSQWASSLWVFDTAKKTVSPVLLDKNGLQTTWDSSQTTGFAFYSNENSYTGGQAWLIGQDGKRIQRMNLLTLPSKCVFYDKPISSATSTTASEKTTLLLFCAVPRDKQAFENKPLPDAYLEKDLFTSDDLFEIEVFSGNLENIFGSSKIGVDADNLKVFGNSLFFTNRFDGKVYYVNLPA
ncbi:MAG: hypothetical protein HY432_03130, partial [Candidatus Liptonbacteria bacterium]|nr:hypothetical protein [Candidatus Liptonbacteria bacterium]